MQILICFAQALRNERLVQDGDVMENVLWGVIIILGVLAL